VDPSLRSRIVGHGEVSPDDLLAHPDNWRIHPEAQQQALAGSLDDVGWVQEVIVNQRTGQLIDGHLRATLAMRRGEPSIPVVYVDLSEDEERLALAALDSITGMAKANALVFEGLLERTNTGSAALQAFVSDFAASIGAGAAEKPPREHRGASEVPETGPLEHTCPDCGFQFD
jgi:hypothetical protein